MNRKSSPLCCVVILVLAATSSGVEAGGIGSAASRAAFGRMLSREAARDAASPAIALRRGMYLGRYATREEFAAEAKHGLRAGQHLVGPGESQRVLSAEAASARFGLPHKAPEIRELWYVPKGTPARVNPVWGGARDASETTLTRPLPPRNLIHADPVAELPR
jgi:hypothetical protein